MTHDAFMIWQREKDTEVSFERVPIFSRCFGNVESGAVFGDRFSTKIAVKKLCENAFAGGHVLQRLQFDNRLTPVGDRADDSPQNHGGTIAHACYRCFSNHPLRIAVA